jgi:hypothetical protein
MTCSMSLEVIRRGQRSGARIFFRTGEHRTVVLED